MLSDVIQDSVSFLQENIARYSGIKNKKDGKLLYSKELIDRIKDLVNQLDKVREEIDSSDIENLK